MVDNAEDMKLLKVNSDELSQVKSLVVAILPNFDVQLLDAAALHWGIDKFPINATVKRRSADELIGMAKESPTVQWLIAFYVAFCLSTRSTTDTWASAWEELGMVAWSGLTIEWMGLITGEKCRITRMTDGNSYEITPMASALLIVVATWFEVVPLPPTGCFKRLLRHLNDRSPWLVPPVTAAPDGHLLSVLFDHAPAGPSEASHVMDIVNFLDTDGAAFVGLHQTAYPRQANGKPHLTLTPAEVRAVREAEEGDEERVLYEALDQDASMRGTTARYAHRDLDINEYGVPVSRLILQQRALAETVSRTMKDLVEKMKASPAPAAACDAHLALIDVIFLIRDEIKRGLAITDLRPLDDPKYMPPDNRAKIIGDILSAMDSMPLAQRCNIPAVVKPFKFHLEELKYTNMAKTCTMRGLMATMCTHVNVTLIVMAAGQKLLLAEPRFGNNPAQPLSSIPAAQHPGHAARDHHCPAP
jgi:hypothetical protein